MDDWPSALVPTASHATCHIARQWFCATGMPWIKGLDVGSKMFFIRYLGSKIVTGMVAGQMLESNEMDESNIRYPECP